MQVSRANGQNEFLECVDILDCVIDELYDLDDEWFDLSDLDKWKVVAKSLQTLWRIRGRHQWIIDNFYFEPILDAEAEDTEIWEIVD